MSPRKPKLNFLGRTLASIVGRLPRPVRSYLNAMGYMGAFATTDPTRLIIEGWLPRNATADQSLTWNLTNLIAQGRQLYRNNCAFKGAVEGWKCDIVGTGIDVEPDTGDDGLNDRIRVEWQRWAEDCTPDHRSLWELQAQAMGEWCTAGAHIWRKVILPDRVDDDRLPLVMCPQEVEWLTLMPIQKVDDANNFVRGIEMDKIGRPQKYHLMDYNLLNQMGLGNAFGGPGEVVPADQIIHGFEQLRPRQSHGEPLLAVIIEKVWQDGNLVDTELKAGRNTAALACAITQDFPQDYYDTRQVIDQYGSVSSGQTVSTVDDFTPGTVRRLLPGEKIELLNNPRPAQQIMPFRKGLRGDLAAGSRGSQFYLDRDPSAANYSSMRMDELITERCRKPLQDGPFARTTAVAAYQAVLPYILLKLGIRMPASGAARRRLFDCKIMPDRPKYVDPVKDSQAAQFMIDNSLSTREEECSNRGKDARKIRIQRLKEMEQDDEDVLQRIATLQQRVATMNAQYPGLNLSWQQVALLNQGAATSPSAYLKASVAGQQVTDEADGEIAPQNDPEAA